MTGKKVEGVMNRLQVFQPAPRDNAERDVCIPDSVLRAQDRKEDKPVRSKVGYAPTNKDDDEAEGSDVEMDNGKKTCRERMWENGGPGVWAPDYREQYDLKDDSWKFDTIPEIIDGKNIADYVDPDIMARLEALEKEEDQLVAELDAAKMGEEEESDLDEEEEAAVGAIRARKKTIKAESQMQLTQNKPMLPRVIRGKTRDKHDLGALDAKHIKKTLDNLGVDSSKMLERGRSAQVADRGRKRERSLSNRRGGDAVKDAAMEDVSGLTPAEIKRAKKDKKEAPKRELSRARSHSRPREPSELGLKDEKSVDVAKKLDRRGRKGWLGAAGEGDNTKAVHLVKWCNTGKKRNGTHYQR
jgi:nucleolar GTP-binding protein